MMTSRKILTLAFVVFSLNTMVRAATYYVDYAAGNDDNAGTTKTSAWKRCPGDANAAGIAAATVLQPGDTVVFRGGVRYKGKIIVGANGSEGNPITLDGNTARDWGSGRAVIDNENDGAYMSAISCSRQHVEIKGFEITNVGGYSDTYIDSLPLLPEITSVPGGTGIALYEARHVRVSDCLLHEVGQWKNQKPFSGPYSITGTGIAIQNATDIVIDGCEMTRMKTGISVKARYAQTVSDIEIMNCDIHNYIVWGIDVAPRSADGVTIQNIFIHDNDIHDHHEYDSGNWQGYGEKPHSDGIFLRTSSMRDSTWTNLNIFNNRFYSGDGGNSAGGTACIYVSEGPSVNIYNNVFIHPIHTRTIGVEFGTVTGTSPQVVRIMNNTFYVNTMGICMAGGPRHLEIVNNVFVRTNTGTAHPILYMPDTSAFPNVLNRNLYYTLAVDGYVAFVTGQGYRSVVGLKLLDWEAEGLYGDPSFVDTSYGTGINAYRNDLRLNAGSPAENAGANLSQYFGTDHLGESRPSQHPWEMGAYEIDSTGLLAPNMEPSLLLTNSPPLLFHVP